MMYSEHEIEGYPLHFRDLRIAIARSLESQVVTYYVREDNKKAMILNGMIFTTVYPDGSKDSFTQEL